MTFIQRLMSVSMVLGTGTFGTTSQNQINMTGLRMFAQISRAGGPSPARLTAEIYGMKLEDMNKLSTLGLVATTLRRNSITVKAGDANGQAVVFQGTIYNAYPDMNGMPDVPFRVEANTGLLESVMPTDSNSYVGPTDVVTVLSSLATIMNVPFENNGVSKILDSPHFRGSPRSQALAAVKQAGICWNGMEDGTLAIWNPGESRGGQVPLISKDTGLVRAPSFNSNGIGFRTLFNPSIGFAKKIQMKSDVLSSANGTWVVHDLNHTLSTLVPGGPWFSDIQAHPPGTGPFVP